MFGRFLDAGRTRSSSPPAQRRLVEAPPSPGGGREELRLSSGRAGQAWHRDIWTGAGAAAPSGAAFVAVPVMPMAPGSAPAAPAPAPAPPAAAPAGAMSRKRTLHEAAAGTFPPPVRLEAARKLERLKDVFRDKWTLAVSEVTRESPAFVHCVREEESHRGAAPPKRWAADTLRRMRDDRFVDSLDADAAARAEIFAPGEGKFRLRHRTFWPERGDIEMRDVHGT